MFVQSRSTWKQLFRMYIDEAREVDETTMNGRCPECNEGKSDNKKRFYLLCNRHTPVVYCHNCGYSTTALNFFRQYDSNLMGDIARNAGNGGAASLFGAPEDDSEEETAENWREESRAFLREHCIPLLESSESDVIDKRRMHAVNYARKRRIPKSIMETLYYCYDGDYDGQHYGGRIIFPLLDERGDMHRFKARDITGQAYIRYHSRVFNSAERGVYRWYEVDPERTVYITEGTVDAVYLAQGVGAGSAQIMRERVFDMAKARFKKTVIVPDNDRAGTMVARRAAEAGFHLFVWPKWCKMKDIGEAVEEGVDIASLIRENIFSPTVALVRMAR